MRNLVSIIVCCLLASLFTHAQIDKQKKITVSKIERSNPTPSQKPHGKDSVNTTAPSTSVPKQLPQTKSPKLSTGEITSFKQMGVASLYEDKFHGRKTSNGEIFDHSRLTAAHLTLPFNSVVKVTNMENGRSIHVRINDRGPFVEGRIIDLTKVAAKELGFQKKGIANVSIEVINNYRDTNTFASGLAKLDTVAREFYKVAAVRHSPRGYGVQIASFAELDKMLEVVEELESLTFREMNIQVTMVNNIQVYRIILGEFAKKEEADKVAKALKEQYKNCYVYQY